MYYLATQKMVKLCLPQHVKCEGECFLLYAKVAFMCGERLFALTVPSLYVFFICTMFMYCFCMYSLCGKKCHLCLIFAHCYTRTLSHLLCVYPLLYVNSNIFYFQPKRFIFDKVTAVSVSPPFRKKGSVSREDLLKMLYETSRYL